ncbi:hypothetical protein D3C72_1275100 [compost metagenome]
MVHRAGNAAQFNHGLPAQQRACRQRVTAADGAMRIGDTGQHVAVGVADRGQAIRPHIQTTHDPLQFAAAQPRQQPAITLHRQRQRHHPAAVVGTLRRPDVQRASLPASLRIGPQRQLQVALAGREGAAVGIEHDNAVQFGVPAQHAGNGGIQQRRRLRRHRAEQLGRIGGDALHRPLQVAQLQCQQALAAYRQRPALPLRGFQPTLVIVGQHRGQADRQQHAQHHAAPGNGTQRPGQRVSQRRHRSVFPGQSAGFMRERFLHIPDLNGRRTPFLTPRPVLHAPSPGCCRHPARSMHHADDRVKVAAACSARSRTVLALTGTSSRPAAD